MAKSRRGLSDAERREISRQYQDCLSRSKSAVEKPIYRQHWKAQAIALARKHKFLRLPEVSRYEHQYLSDDNCLLCYGLGTNNKSEGGPCDCVCRRAFLWAVSIASRYNKEVDLGCTKIFYFYRRTQGISPEFPLQDFCADVDGTAKAALNRQEYHLFRLHLVRRLTMEETVEYIRKDNEWAKRMGIEEELLDYSKGVFYRLARSLRVKIGRLYLERNIVPTHHYFDAQRTTLFSSNHRIGPRRDPFLNGGAWEEFRDNDEWADQYKAYLRNNRLWMSQTNRRKGE